MKRLVFVRLAWALALGLVLFVSVTWWALESDGVGVVDTHGRDGSIRSTHVWYVQQKDELLLEAGSPRSPWFLDILSDADVSFTLDGRSRRYTAHILEEPAAQGEIRALLRDKYGIRDRWVALLVDSSRSVPVRLEPAFGTGPR